MSNYTRTFGAFLLFFMVAENTTAAVNGAGTDVTTATGLVFTILAAMGIALIYRINSKSTRLKPVRIRKRRK